MWLSSLLSKGTPCQWPKCSPKARPPGRGCDVNDPAGALIREEISSVLNVHGVRMCKSGLGRFAVREATLSATALRSMGAHTMSYEHFADSARAQPHLLGVHLWSARSEQPRGQFSEPTTSPSPPCPRVPTSHPTDQPARITRERAARAAGVPSTNISLRSRTLG